MLSLAAAVGRRGAEPGHREHSKRYTTLWHAAETKKLMLDNNTTIAAGLRGRLTNLNDKPVMSETSASREDNVLKFCSDIL